jgi:hypothetical protein
VRHYVSPETPVDLFDARVDSVTHYSAGRFTDAMLILTNPSLPATSIAVTTY